MKRFLRLLVALVILIALLFGVAWIPVRDARDAWLAGRNSVAIGIAEQWSKFHLWQRQYHQIFALAFLISLHKSGILSRWRPEKSAEALDSAD